MFNWLFACMEHDTRDTSSAKSVPKKVALDQKSGQNSILAIESPRIPLWNRTQDNNIYGQVNPYFYPTGASELILSNKASQTKREDNQDVFDSQLFQNIDTNKHAL